MPTNHPGSCVIALPLAVCQATATLAIPCTGALGATPHRACIAANLAGHVSPPGTRSTGGNGWLPEGRPGPASLKCRPARGLFEGYRGYAARILLTKDSDRPVAAAIARPVYCIAPPGGSKSAGGNGGRLGFFFPVAPRAGDAFTHEPRSPAPRRVSKSRSGVAAYLGNKASLQ